MGTRNDGARLGDTHAGSPRGPMPLSRRIVKPFLHFRTSGTAPKSGRNSIRLSGIGKKEAVQRPGMIGISDAGASRSWLAVESVGAVRRLGIGVEKGEDALLNVFAFSVGTGWVVDDQRAVIRGG